MEDNKQFGTQIPDEVYQFIKAMEKPNVDREFETLMNAVADKSDIEKKDFLKRAIRKFERSENKPHTYPWYYKEMLVLLREEKELIEEKLNDIKNFSPESLKQDKTDLIKPKLDEIGFYTLPMVKKLTENCQNKLIELITYDKAYAVAMFDYLKFFNYLDNEYGTKKDANLKIAHLWDEEVSDPTQIRHYRNSLIEPRNTNNAFHKKEIVRNDYEKLTKGDIPLL